MDGPDKQEPFEPKHSDQLAEMFLKMGAERAQADVMAKQLWKRAGQLARERGISEVEALETLLKRVIQAREER
jgi:hypothetical protein